MAIEGMKTSPKLRIPVRGFMILLIAVILLPPMALLTLTILRTGASDRQAAERRLVDSAQLVAGMVDSTLTANAAMVRSMAENGSTTDLRAIAGYFGGTAHALTANLVPFEEREWSVSNLFSIDPGVGAKVALSVPYDNQSGLLSLTADAAALTAGIDLTRAGSEMLVAVVDGNGRVVARSVQQQEFIGRAVPTWQALLDVGAPSGIFSAQTLEGSQITFGFATIPGTPGWAVVIGLPKAIFDARWMEPITALVVAAAIALVIAFGLTLSLSARIIGPISALVARSRDIALGADAALTMLPPARIKELDELQSAQTAAHIKLAERARELDLSGQRYRAIAKVGARVTWRRDLDGNLLDAEGWQELTGQSIEQAHGAGWLELVHPDDVDTVRLTWKELRHGTRPMDFECRIRVAAGDFVWMHIRAAAITDSSGATIEWIGTVENIDTRKRRQLHLSHLAYHDPLTGLPNRASLHERLTLGLELTGASRPGALLYIDLDRFKQANDTFGHATGDEVLRQVGLRLQNALRPFDMAARLGGDEFAVLLYEVHDNDMALMIGMRIVKSISRPFKVAEHQIEIGASIGITLIEAGESSLTDLFQHADTALYQSKAGGRNRCSFFSPELLQDRA